MLSLVQTREEQESGREQGRFNHHTEKGRQRGGNKAVQVTELAPKALVDLTEVQDSLTAQCITQHQPDTKLTHLWQEKIFFFSCNWWGHLFLSGRNYSSQLGGLYSSRHCLSPGQAWLQGAQFPYAFKKHIHFSRKLWCLKTQPVLMPGAECSSSQKANWRSGWKTMVPGTELLPSV